MGIFSRCRLLSSLLFSIPLLGAGCTGDIDDDDQNGGGGTGPDMCTPCAAGELHYACCIPGSDDCSIECLADDGSEDCPVPYTAPGGRVTCDNSVSETNGSWDPSSVITFNSQTGEYEIDQTAWDGLLKNPGQLLHDGARVEPAPGAGYRFIDIKSGDFFDELGFQNLDTLVSINGRSIRTDTDAWAAFNDFYGSTTFRVSVSRGGSTVTMRYVIQ